MFVGSPQRWCQPPVFAWFSDITFHLKNDGHFLPVQQEKPRTVENAAKTTQKIISNWGGSYCFTTLLEYAMAFSCRPRAPDSGRCARGCGDVWGYLDRQWYLESSSGVEKFHRFVGASWGWIISTWGMRLFRGGWPSTYVTSEYSNKCFTRRMSPGAIPSKAKVVGKPGSSPVNTDSGHRIWAKLLGCWTRDLPPSNIKIGSKFIPSPVLMKHPPNGPNGMWEFPTSTMVSFRGCLVWTGMGFKTSGTTDLGPCLVFCLWILQCLPSPLGKPMDQMDQFLSKPWLDVSAILGMYNS